MKHPHSCWLSAVRRIPFVAIVSLLIILCGDATPPAPAQGQSPSLTVRRGALASAPVLPYRFNRDVRSLPKARQWQLGDPVIERPRPGTWGREKPEVVPFLPRSSTMAIPFQRPLQASRVPDPPILNFAGTPFTGVVPPDTVGDVGPNHYIQMVNNSNSSFVRIYNRSGALLAPPFLLSSLGVGGACVNGLGDPIVLYDGLANRWMLSEFSDTTDALCVYVSQTADPVSGGWFRYQFNTPGFPDYPKYAVWPDAYYVSTNEDPAVYALDRVKMLAGLAATSQRFTVPSLAGFSFQALTPADLDGPTAPPAGAPAYFMRHRDDEVHNPPGTAQDFVEVWQFDVDFTTPANSTFTGPFNIAVTPFDSALCGLGSSNCFPQPGTGVTLDPLREVIMWRLQYRNFGTHETMVGNFVTDTNASNHGGIRWFELRKIGAGNWTLFQEGTVSPDADHRWMGSSAMNGQGAIALGYNVSNPTTVFPSLRYTGRIITDPPGQMPQGEQTLIAGASAQTSTSRWGDYNAMSVDPTDDCTFWFTGEYMPAGGFWSTRIGSFRIGSCPCAAVTLTPPNQVMSAGVGTANVTVAIPSGCAWTAVSPVPWVTITGGSPGNGNGTMSYSVTANAGPNPRRGTLTIADKTFTVSQNTPVPASCTISASAPGNPIGTGGGTGSVMITASTASCQWRAQSHVAWITLTSATTGSGSGPVGYSVAANQGGPRKGRITVNGKSVMISQS